MIRDVKVSNNQVLVTLSGEIYVEESTVLREQLLQCLEKGLSHFVFNLSEVNYIDSSGLGVLVAIHKRALQNKGQVTIQGLNGSVKELFELTRLTKVFPTE
ncbi:STAS domain-containing protein [Aneurinibacillus sp. Ricciae_BoGa-3]|uniref:STAS domain-containing protein n=1 Tax=Aneurinibacillus sp. Ricciae_BoGa-3 TaxID=3022697 RepID=UPI0023420460|nr:STAS domain-containing protein [Aneurinibacillus sp. Ricciae_BoGa-3]WCK53928.1 STAS domain-containing protein [Aneurinibacillus sp. Ricciae_BoGa-3]